MLHSLTRRLGVQALVRLVFGLAFLTIFTRSAHAEAAPPIFLAETDFEPGVVVYPAQAQGTRPVTVVLHGMCGEPERTCRYFSALVSERTHLICPRARRRCEGGGGSTWPENAGEQIESAVARGIRALAGRVDEQSGRTLIGYSMGAFRALTLAESSRGRYPRVMLIGAKVYPSARLLRENGVARLLLAAGDWDMMSAHMRQQANKLTVAGYAVHFMSLGHVGHAFTEGFADYLPTALDWLAAGEETSSARWGHASLVRLVTAHEGDVGGTVRLRLEGPIDVAVDLLDTDQKAIVSAVVMLDARRARGTIGVFGAIRDAAVAALERQAALPGFGAICVLRAARADASTIGLAATVIVAPAGRQNERKHDPEDNRT